MEVFEEVLLEGAIAFLTSLLIKSLRNPDTNEKIFVTTRIFLWNNTFKVDLKYLFNVVVILIIVFILNLTFNKKVN